MKPKIRMIRWAELLEEEKSELLPHVNAIFEKPQPEFDNFGLRHSLPHLNRVGGGAIFLPLEYMAEYVDVVTKKAIDEQDPVFLLKQVLSINSENIDKINLENFNTTSLGNLAYVALHAHSEDARNIAECLLEKYLNWFEISK